MNAGSPSPPLKGSHTLLWVLSEDSHHHSLQDISLLLYHAVLLREDYQQERTWGYSKHLEDMATASSHHEGMVIPLSGAGDSTKSPGPDIGILKD